MPVLHVHQQAIPGRYRNGKHATQSEFVERSSPFSFRKISQFASLVLLLSLTFPAPTGEFSRLAVLDSSAGTSIAECHASGKDIFRKLKSSFHSPFNPPISLWQLKAIVEHLPDRQKHQEKIHIMSFKNVLTKLLVETLKYVALDDLVNFALINRTTSHASKSAAGFPSQLKIQF